MNLLKLFSGFIAVVFSSVFVLFSSFVGAQSNNSHLINDEPNWVISRSPAEIESLPITKIKNGVFYRLIDNQININKEGDRTHFVRYVETLVNQVGIENNSQINISYDPNYQKVILNSLSIIRDGKVIDKLSDAQITLLSKEDELKNNTYNGYLTLNILVDGIQVGDSLDYSFTKYGFNPIYEGIFSYGAYLNFSVPVHEQFLRILWGKSQELFVNSLNFEPVVNKKKLGDFLEYSIYVKQPKVLHHNSESPGWFIPNNVIYFSEVSSWNEVAKWADGLYQFNDISNSVKAIADNIKTQHNNTKDQIASALSYVQNNIRYVGLQMGINSHLPTPPQETLKLKYGDCKDKAVLLINILAALDIVAYPALVNTEITKQLADKPPALNYFDHVIVTLDINGNKLWLDPTLRFQSGDLVNLSQTQYGYALIVNSNQKELTAIAVNTDSTAKIITEEFTIPKTVESSVVFNVKNQFSGADFSQKKSQLERYGLNQLSKDYEDYYRKTYNKISSQALIKVTVSENDNVLNLHETYLIDDFWGLEDGDYFADFYPNDIRETVYKPEEIKRTSPLSFKFPNKIENNIHIKFMESGWSFDDSSFIENNDFFSFTATTAFIDNELRLGFSFQSKTDHIPADKIEDYLAARKRLREKAYFGIIKFSKVTIEEAEDEMLEYDWIFILSALYIIGFVFIIIAWRIESRSRPQFDNTVFFPISVTKFTVLSIFTFGFYTSYWMYRNWKAINALDIMPMARGIFSAFWLYPLYLKLREDSIKEFNNNNVLPAVIAGMIAFIYLAAYIFQNLFDNLIVIISSTLVPLLFIPFVKYINSRNTTNKKACLYNSQWNVRHFITLLLCAPLLIYMLVLETPLLPSNSVITQSSMMKSDLNFIYRKKIIPANETINYFYSDALFSIRDDGNGFTDQRIFSYWLDEKDDFNSESATFDKIEKIDVKYANTENENTIITITRHDKSTFMVFVSSVDKGDKIFIDKLNKLKANF